MNMIGRGVREPTFFIRPTSRLHEVRRIGTPYSILLKPGRLTAVKAKGGLLIFSRPIFSGRHGVYFAFP